MKYVFQFGIVWDHLPQLLNGAWLTLRLSLGAFVLGFALAVLLAFLRTAARGRCASAIAAYVEFIRNTPFLVQLFIIYFSLPAIGIRMEAVTAALLGMSLNFSGYAHRDHPLRHRGGAAQPDRGGAFARPHAGCRSSATSSFFPRCAPCIRRWPASSCC